MLNLNFNSNFILKIKKSLFPFYKNNELNYLFKRLKENLPKEKKVAMFVGGCVRKHLSSQEVDDIDIATSLTTDQIKEKFKDTKFKIIDTGIKHGTLTLVLGQLKVELTTLRKDVKTDGRHAEIEYTDDWQEDSKRRDFTINAIYLDINGKIFDPQSGVEDLKNKKVKFIGDAEKRIKEDYLRIIRFIRFSLEYDNEIERTSIQAIKLNLGGIKKISKERILKELFKILVTKNFIKLNKNTSLKNIFLLIFPEFKNLERLNKLETILNQTNFDIKTLLAVLLVDKTNNHEYFSHKYNVSNDLRENLNLVNINFVNFQTNKNFFLKDLKKNIYFFGKKHLTTLHVLNFLDNKKLKVKNFLDLLDNIKKLNIPKFAFDGNYLIKNGMKEGALMGKTLKIIENEWLNNNFEISIERVLEIIKTQNN
jgi:poly(A) polymerase